MGLGKYLKVAFQNHWNLLALLGGVGFGLLSGAPDVVLPVVIAGEVAYLGLLGTHPKFRKYVDAQDAKSAQAQKEETNEQALKRILQALPKPAHDRFEQLRNRCLELRQIATDLKQPGAVPLSAPLDSLQLAGLERLLWVFLRLLFTQHSLARFLQRTRVQTIQEEIGKVEARLKSYASKPDTPHHQKIRHTLEDNLQTLRDRLANYEKAVANYEFVELEIDRLENKIKSLAEVAVNRQEPDYISSQVNQVASSMLQTEQTMNELEFATGLSHLDEDPPELMQPPIVNAQVVK